MQARPALFELISGRANWLSQRQAVLTRNLANADTPGFTPLDLVPPEPEAMAGGGAQILPLLRTDAAHLGTDEASGAGAPVEAKAAKSFETKPGGNGVVLAEELEKMSRTDLDYQLTTNLYRRYVGLLRTAIGAQQG